MSPDDLHKILVPYIYATVLLVVVLGIAAWMLKWDGDRKRSEMPAQSNVKDRPRNNRRGSA